MIKNIFEMKYGTVIMAFAGTLEEEGEAVGYALNSIGFSPYKGKPILQVRMHPFQVKSLLSI